MREDVTFSVAVGGLGSVGAEVARALDRGIPGLELVYVSARDAAKATRTVEHFRRVPELVPLSELSRADIVIEALPSSAFDGIAEPAVEHGRVLVVASCGALLSRRHLVDRARRTGARLVVPSGALAGLDAVRAAAEGGIRSARLETRKPPEALLGAPYLETRGIDVATLTEAMLVFSGSAYEAALAFPSNTNVAAALSLAGIGPDRTKVDLWADPTIRSNVHVIHVEAETGNITTRIEAVPNPQNPRSSSLTPLSIVASLRSLFATMSIGA